MTNSTMKIIIIATIGIVVTIGIVFLDGNGIVNGQLGLRYQQDTSGYGTQSSNYVPFTIMTTSNNFCSDITAHGYPQDFDEIAIGTLSDSGGSFFVVNSILIKPSHLDDDEQIIIRSFRYPSYDQHDFYLNLSDEFTEGGSTEFLGRETISGSKIPNVITVRGLSAMDLRISIECHDYREPPIMFGVGGIVVSGWHHPDQHIAITYIEDTGFTPNPDDRRSFSSSE